MTSTNDIRTDAGPAPRRDGGPKPRRFRSLVLTGVIATPAAMAATTAGAALARTAGVDFEIPDGGGERIPLAGFAAVTGFFALIGVVIAAALLRWSTDPARRFLQTTLSLTAISLIPPFLSGAAPSTVTALLALHLIAAAVMISTLTRHLRRTTT